MPTARLAPIPALAPVERPLFGDVSGDSMGAVAGVVLVLKHDVELVVVVSQERALRNVDV